MAVNVQLAIGLGSTPISSFSCLPSKWLGGRLCKAPLYEEPQYPNHMISDAMNHPIHFLCCCMLRWDLGSKLFAASDISNCCCSSKLPNCRQILGCLSYLCCCLLFCCFLLLCCCLCHLRGKVLDYDVCHFCRPHSKVMGFIV